MDYKISFDWYLIVIFLGICQALLLSVVLLVRSRDSGSRFIFLSLFMFALAVILTEVFLNYSGYILNIIQIDKFSFPFQFLIAPSIFLFIKSGLYPGRPKNIWAHYLVFVLILAYFSIYYVQDNAFKFNMHIDENHLTLNKLPVDSRVRYDPFYIHRNFHLLVFTQILLYGFFIWGVLRKKYREAGIKLINREASYINHYRNLFIYYILAIIFFAIILARYFQLGDFLFSLYLTCVVYLISINIFYRSLNNYFHSKQTVKYASSSLNDSDKQEILSRIKEVVENEDFYCQSNASLEEISRRTRISKHYVSQVINELLGISLFEYLAKCRIRKSKSLLSDPKYHNLTIDEISFMVGYNSRSAFNRVFKSMEGTTPAAYRKNNS